MTWRYLKHRFLMAFSVRYHVRYLAELHLKRNFDQDQRNEND